jgi:hypothetical protein
VPTPFSSKPITYNRLPELEYPFHDETVLVTTQKFVGGTGLEPVTPTVSFLPGQIRTSGRDSTTM